MSVNKMPNLTKRLSLATAIFAAISLLAAFLATLTNVDKLPKIPFLTSSDEVRIVGPSPSPTVVSAADVEFTQHREAVYKDRRDLVAKTCKKTKIPKFRYEGRARVAGAISYDPRTNLAYCQIPKSGSSTLSRTFALLVGAPMTHKHYQLANSKHFKPTVSKKGYMTSFNASTVSMVIVRNPLSRLASAYVSKMVLLGNRTWRNVTRRIIRRYGIQDKNIRRTPTPEEFLRYIIEKPYLNAHWRPQYLMCPFCEVNFTIYSHLEDLYIDLAYFMLRAGKAESAVIDPFLQENQSRDREKTQRNFWQRVTEKTVSTILRVFATDFDMFGYSPTEYLQKYRSYK